MSKTKRAKDDWANWKADPKNKWKETRDKKRWNKPTKKFKKMNRSKERAKENGAVKNAVANNKDFDGVIVPVAKRHDAWDWN